MLSYTAVCVILLFALGRTLTLLFRIIILSSRSIPGPFWTRFTRIWFLSRVSLGNFELENIKLHRKYGPIVRIAPGMFSIDLPDVVNQIYGISSRLQKSDWYDGWKPPNPEFLSLFSDRDIKRHAELRRRFQALYSMSSLVGYETYVNDCTDILQTRFKEFSAKGESINMIHWLQCYAFDVIGDITYSKRFGFLDSGEDVFGLLEALHGQMIYSTLIGIYSALHPYVFAVMRWLNIGGVAGQNYLVKFVESIIQQRKIDRETNTENNHLRAKDGPPDFLEKLLIQSEENSNKVKPSHVLMMGLANVIAGSDTTAISLAAILRNLIKSPNTMGKLRVEIDQCIADNLWDGGHVTFKVAQNMPYLQAVIKEALRMHPATGLPLWRVIPKGGMQINEQFFPGGTIVGLNPWTAHYNEDVFGKDARKFRPERWIEAEEEGGENLRRMNSYYLPVRMT